MMNSDKHCSRNGYVAKNQLGDTFHWTGTGLTIKLLAMKKIFKLLFIFVFLLCNATTCDTDKCHKTIAFVNCSLRDVYISFTVRTLDTLRFYKNFSNPFSNPEACMVKIGEKNTVALRYRDCYDNFYVTDNSMFVYVFDAEVLETIPWDTVGKYYMVLKTIRPTLEEMERDNWTIYFTGE